MKVKVKFSLEQTVKAQKGVGVELYFSCNSDARQGVDG